ncbi:MULTISPECIES: ABC transporter substrate-binding protein [Mumia]|uniref:ABC transporter substrate-binding protein n=1 Tax=Mumia xiangluensis TaxID=1678900 RepID=A0ABW1QMC4_9ACTN|nr:MULTISPECIES: ABC transporter substrate-binding protein [Mumia]
MGRRLGRVLALVCSGFLLVAACTSADSPDDSASTSNATPDHRAAGRAGSAKDPHAQAPAAEIPGATRGGQLRVLSASVPDSLDPAQASFVDTRSVLSGLVTRSLTQFRRDPVTGDMELVPDLATDLGAVNDAGTTWSFTLRAGIQFEDGTPVTAEDVAYGIKRAFADDVLPGAPAYLRTFFLDGDLYHGPYATTAELRERPGYKPGWYAGDSFRGIEVSGRTITFRLSRPFADMPYLASFPQFSPVPRAADSDPAAYGRHPVATGPYAVEVFRDQTTLVLRRNESWDPATDPGRHQYADGWTFLWGQDTDRIEGLLLDDAGDAQYALSYDSLGVDTATRLLEEAPSRVITAGTPCTYLWYLDTRKITDKRVRHALGWAYPYEAAWQAEHEIVGTTRVPGTTLMPPGVTGQVEYDPLSNGGRRTDAARARKLLVKADAVGFPVQWYYASDVPEKVAVKDAVVAALERAGFDPMPIATTAKQIRRMQFDPTGPHDVVDSGWCSDWPTGSSWFPAQWSSDHLDDPARPNPSMLDEPEVQDEIDRILDTLSGKAAAKAWGALDKRIGTEFYPAVVLGHQGVVLAHGSRVGGMAVNEMQGMPLFADLFVDQGT